MFNQERFLRSSVMCCSHGARIVFLLLFRNNLIAFCQKTWGMIHPDDDPVVPEGMFGGSTVRKRKELIRRLSPSHPTPSSGEF